MSTNKERRTRGERLGRRDDDVIVRVQIVELKDAIKEQDRRIGQLVDMLHYLIFGRDFNIRPKMRDEQDNDAGAKG